MSQLVRRRVQAHRGAFARLRGRGAGWEWGGAGRGEARREWGGARDRSGPVGPRTIDCPPEPGGPPSNEMGQ
jgi:hypothetical protein